MNNSYENGIAGAIAPADGSLPQDEELSVAPPFRAASSTADGIAEIQDAGLKPGATFKPSFGPNNERLRKAAGQIRPCATALAHIVKPS